MRPHIHFDALDVIERRANSGWARNIHTIQVESRSRITQFGVVARADPADVDFDVTLVVGDRKAWNLILKVRNVLNTQPFEVLARYRERGTRKILQRLFTAISGDDDRLGIFSNFLILLFSSLTLVLRKSGRGQRDCGCPHGKRNGKTTHFSLPCLAIFGLTLTGVSRFVTGHKSQM